MKVKTQIWTPGIVLTALFILCCSVASAKEAEPISQPNNAGVSQPIGGAKPVTTMTIKRCPDGYELVIRASGRRGCAKDIVPPNE